MARQVLPIVGAIVGGYVGGPQGAQIGFAIGSVVGNAVDPQRLAGPKIGEIPVQTAEEGAVCPLIAGTSPAIGNLIYKHLFPPVTVEEQQGKGGGPIIESERLYGTFAIRICASLFDGPGNRVGVTGIRKIWEDEKLVYDVSEDSVILAESAAYAEGFTFYPGNETQLPDPDLEAIEGVGNVPAYRGRAYVVFNYKDLTDRKGSVPQFRFEMTVDAEEIQGLQLVTNVRHYGGSRDALSIAPTNIGWPATTSIVRVSPSGEYAAGSIPGAISSSRFTLLKFDPDAQTWSALSAPAYLPGKGPRGIAWSPDSGYLAVCEEGTTEFDRVVIYKREGDVFTKLPDPEEGLPGTPNSGPSNIAWDSVGQRLAVARSSSSTQIYLWDFVADALVNRRNATGLSSVSSRTLDFMPGAGSRYIAMGASGAGGVAVFRIEDDELPLAAHLDAAAGVTGGITGAWWDYSSGYLVCVGDDIVFVLEFDRSIIGSETLTLESIAADALPSASVASSIAPGRRHLAVATSDLWPSIYAWTETLPPSPAILADPASGPSGIVSVSWTGQPDLPQLSAGTASLPSVISAIVGRVKQPSSLVNTSQVSSEIVRGLSLGSQDYTAADALRSLAQVYLYDTADYDEQLHIVPRGGSVQFSITEDDLVEAPGDSFLRSSAIEQPGKISLFFQNPTIYYQPSKVNPPFIGYENGAVNEVSVQVPVVLRDSDEAPQLVDKMQKISETDAQGEITRVVSDRFLEVVPSAVGAITERGITRRVRVTGVEEYDYRMKLKMRIDRQSAVTSNVTATPVPAPDPPPPSLAGITQFAVLNIPAIIDQDDALGIRVAVCGLSDTAWSGCRVDYSSDGGASWTTLQTITRAAPMGTLLNTVNDASPYYTDTTNTLSVLLFGNEVLETLTQEQFLSEGNGAALWYSDGTAELIQFRDAVDDGDKEWTLSYLLRGRLATEPGEHMPGTQFVMLSGTTFLPLPSALIGTTVRLRFTSLGTSPETAPTYDFVWLPANSQREFPPAHLFLSRSGDDISCEVVPRHRLGTENNPIASINWTGYRWTATDGSNTATQDTATTDPAATFDVTGWASPVTVTVAMTNRITGAGPTISEDIA